LDVKFFFIVPCLNHSIPEWRPRVDEEHFNCRKTGEKNPYGEALLIITPVEKPGLIPTFRYVTLKSIV
jgi:hypothetical protein